ncbi:hypothetical protein ISCGN_013464 [Ixodes scapularis]
MKVDPAVAPERSRCPPHMYRSGSFSTETPRETASPTIGAHAHGGHAALRGRRSDGSAASSSSDAGLVPSVTVHECQAGAEQYPPVTPGALREAISRVRLVGASGSPRKRGRRSKRSAR